MDVDVESAREAYEQAVSERPEVVNQLKRERKIKQENHLGPLIFDALRGEHR